VDKTVFGGSGSPVELIHTLIDRFMATGSPNSLTVINNNSGNGQVGLAAMIRERMVTKLVCSYPRSIDPRVFNNAYEAGEIELELVPQGTLAERIRAGGAGIPAFYTPTAFGTELASAPQWQWPQIPPLYKSLDLSAPVTLIRKLSSLPVFL